MHDGERAFRGLIEHWKEDPEYTAQAIALELSAAITRKLEELSLTRTELSRRLKVSPGRVSQVLAGNVNLTLLSVCKAALAVGLRPSMVFASGDANATGDVVCSKYFDLGTAWASADLALFPQVPRESSIYGASRRQQVQGWSVEAGYQPRKLNIECDATASTVPMEKGAA